LLSKQKKDSLKGEEEMHKLFPLFSLVVLASLVLAACGGTAATPVTVEVTRIVTASGGAEAPAAETPAAETPAATEPPAAGGETDPPPPLVVSACKLSGPAGSAVAMELSGFGFVE
jgi:hypothetical protein